MKHTNASPAIVTVLLLIGFATCAYSQDIEATLVGGGVTPSAGTVVRPKSSVRKPEDKGLRAHTNLEVLIPAGGRPLEAPPFFGYGYETPASLACIYKLVSVVPGCNPNATTASPTGGSQAIAIVDAYDDPLAADDLAYFSAQFGLPFGPSTLSVVYASGNKPPEDPSGGWELEESVDIEYAHAMAPNATIYLVEADSNSDLDLLTAVTVATHLVQCRSPSPCPSPKGAGEVSMSWGGGEFSGETIFDSYFNQRNVVFFAASGDVPGNSWPCISPNVVCAGGTTTARSPQTGNFLYELTWGEAGGGLSAFERRPAYQNTLSSKVGPYRGVPDLSFDSNPDTGAWVWDSNDFEGGPGGWFIVGGTSLASPSLAGIVNSAATLHKNFAISSSAENATIYANRAVAADFHDLTLGYCGPYSGYKAAGLWDVCTGVGSIVGYAGK
jgi:subtilase family serine protease